MGRAKEANGWVILRTAGPRTIGLAASLSAASIEAWTPVETVKRRRPGGRSGKIERPAPITPTIVFARASSLGDLLRITRAPTSPHPRFSLFRHDGRFPVVADREIERLRQAERKAQPKGKRVTFADGDTVKTTEAGFTGLEGVVQRTKGQWAFVCFGGRHEVKIASFLLSSSRVAQTAFAA